MVLKHVFLGSTIHAPTVAGRKTDVYVLIMVSIQKMRAKCNQPHSKRSGIGKTASKTSFPSRVTKHGINSGGNLNDLNLDPHPASWRIHGDYIGKP